MPQKRKSASPDQVATPPTDSRRKKTDWDAVERDYRTGNFTLRELAEKHGATHTTISRRAERLGWTKDLSDAIRQATNAKLVQQAVQQKCNDAHHDATQTVLIAAEINKQVILGHREDLGASRKIANDLLAELASSALLAEDQELLAQILAGSGAEPADEARARATVQKALSLSGRVKSIKDLADAFTKIHDGERRAFNIVDAAAPQQQNNPIADLLAELSARGSRLPVKRES